VFFVLCLDAWTTRTAWPNGECLLSYYWLLFIASTEQDVMYS